MGVNDLQNVENVVQTTLLGNPLLFAYLFTVRVFAEEVFFRGFLTPKIGPVFSSIIFAFGHFSFGSNIEVVGALLLGIVLALFFQKNRNIFPNIAGHFLYNIAALVMIY